MDSPDFLLRSLPLSYSVPIKTINILENSRGVDDHIVLPVVNQDFYLPKDINHILGIALRNVSTKSSVHKIVSGYVLYGCSEFSFVVIEELTETLV